MDWFNEKDVQAKLKEIPKFKMSNSSYEQIKSSLKSTMQTSRRSRESTSKIKSVVIALSGIAVATIVFMNIPLHHSSKIIHTTTGGTVATPSTHLSNSTQTTNDTKGAPYNFSKFLSFTPLLPSNTSGLAVNSSDIAITPLRTSFFADYGDQGSKWFTVEEVASSKSQPILMKADAKTTKVVKDGQNLLVSGITSEKYGNQPSYSSFGIALLKNHVNYSMSFSSTIPLSEAEDIATHINVVDTQKPSLNIATSSVSKAMKVISFKPVIPPKTLNVQPHKMEPTLINAGTDIDKKWQDITFGYEAHSLININEKIGVDNWAKQIFTRSKKIMIDGQTAYLVNTKSTGPCLMWIDPHSSILIWVQTQPPSQNVTLEKQVAAIVMKAAKS